MTTCLANALAAQDGYRVIVLSKSISGLYPFYEFNPSIDYTVLRGKLHKGVFAVLEATQALREFIRKEHIDVLIAVDVSLGVFTLPLHSICRHTKWVYWDHFSMTYANGNKRLASLRKLTARFGNAYVTLTEDDSAIASRWAGKKAHCIQNMCPYEESDTPYSTDSRSIISVGNLIPIKGFDMALKVADIVLLAHPDWEWRFYGDGSSMDSLKEQAKSCAMSDRIRFCGRVKNMDEVYSGAAILVMTSRSEGYGLVLSEAQAFKIPTVAFDVPFGPRSIIRDGVDGYLIKPFDTVAMAERLKMLIEQPDLRRTLSDSVLGKSRLLNKEITDKWLALLKEIML